MEARGVHLAVVHLLRADPRRPGYGHGHYGQPAPGDGDGAGAGRGRRHSRHLPGDPRPGQGRAVPAPAVRRALLLRLLDPLPHELLLLLFKVA